MYVTKKEKDLLFKIVCDAIESNIDNEQFIKDVNPIYKKLLKK
jgi:hypothetical protein